MANLKSIYDQAAPACSTTSARSCSFYVRALAWTPRTVVRYKKEILRILAETTLGSGALAVIGGTVGVIVAMCFFTGTEVGLQGYAALNQLGTASFAGFVSAYFNTREIAPLVAAIGLAATVGCGFTAQLGAMRISEEVDALEVMAIPSLPFLVTTRIIGGLIAIIPLYVVGLLSSYFASRLVVTQFFGQSSGTYDHYFNQFLPPGDVLWSFGKVLVFAVVVILIHCYYGYNAGGGPAGVGVAVGRAVRTSIVAINVHRPAPVDGDLGRHHHGEVGGMTLRRRRQHKVLGVVFLALVVLAGLPRLRDVHQEVHRLRRVKRRDLQDRPAAARARRREDPRRHGRRGARHERDRRRRRADPGAVPEPGRHDPRQRHRLDRAQDAVRREVRLPDRPGRRRPRRRSRPATPSSAPSVSTEVEKVLSDLYPLLRTVEPAELNMTLNALATALEGRGDQIGENLETVDSYLKRLNPQIPALVEDLRLTA